MEKRFDVVIFEYATGIIETIGGEGMREKRAEDCADFWLGRCNENYGTALVPTGTAKAGKKVSECK